MSSDDRWCEAKGIAPAWSGQEPGETVEMKRRIAVLEERLREAYVEVARLKADLRVAHDAAQVLSTDLQAANERNAELRGQSRPDTSPEPWESIVTAAIRWRKGMDRGELAAAVDAFTGEYVGPQGSVAIVGGVLYPQKLPTSDLKGLAARESIVEQGRRVYQDGVLAGHVVPMDTTGVCVLRPEQYADGAGAQAWRQAMGGKL